jgi:hypothetical protein
MRTLETVIVTVFYMFKQVGKKDQIQWWTPVVPATWEAKTGGLLKPGVQGQPE